MDLKTKRGPFQQFCPRAWLISCHNFEKIFSVCPPMCRHDLQIEILYIHDLQIEILYILKKKSLKKSVKS